MNIIQALQAAVDPSTLASVTLLAAVVAAAVFATIASKWI